MAEEMTSQQEEMILVQFLQRTREGEYCPVAEEALACKRADALDLSEEYEGEYIYSIG